MKRTNKTADPVAESAEGRARAKRNGREHDGVRTQRRDHTTSGLAAVREAARGDRSLVFTNLMAQLTPQRLYEAFKALDRSAAAGSDGVRWQDYQEGLGERLRALHARLHEGRYRPRPARRVVIPKVGGGERQLGILCIEDKIVQQAVGEILSSVYETDFLGFSYGFRRGRGQHDALDALAVGLQRRKVDWVLDLDIQKFFDTVEHDWMLRFLRHRVGDPRIIRLIRQWLEVGHLDDAGCRVRARQGMPQGAVISPLLSNVYLHYAFDLWVEQWRRRHARGDVIVVRYADDSVLGFQHRDDAEAFQRALAARLDTFGLSLHPEKTRLVRFGRFAARDAREAGEGKAGTFDFLGFTHAVDAVRPGWFRVRRLTAKSRRAALLARIRAELRRRRHHPIARTGAWLRRVLQGHINYFGVPLNGARVSALCDEARTSWYRSLRRRSQRTRMNWRRYRPIADFWLPRGRVVHPYPQLRFDAMYSRQEPDA